MYKYEAPLIRKVFFYVCAALEKKKKHYMGATFQQTVYRSVYLTFRVAGTT